MFCFGDINVFGRETGDGIDLPKPQGGGVFRYFSGRGEHWKEVEEEENQDRGKDDDLRW